MAEATMLPRTPIAVTVTYHYSHGLFSVWPQVYFQDPRGCIRFVNGNEGGKSTVCVEAANLNKQFAAISWGGPETTTPQEVGDSSFFARREGKTTDKCTQERLYYTNRSGQIFEVCLEKPAC